MSKVIRDKGYTLDRDGWFYYICMKPFHPDKAKQYKARVLRREYKPQEDKWKLAHIDEEGDSFILKRFFTGTFDDEEWKDFVDNTWEEIYSPYDCTGKRFSYSLERYEVPGGTWVYHRMALDV